MSRIICLETDDSEVFVNLDNVSQASITADTVEVRYVCGEIRVFTGAAAHALIQSLRHEELRAVQHG
jgi:hypothetical protein